MDHNFTFAQRTQWESLENRLVSTMEQLKKDGIYINDLSESNPTKCQFNYPSAKILDAFVNESNLSYSPDPKGMLKAREAVASYYAAKGIQISLEHIFLTASTSEAYSYLFRLLVNVGEKVLLPAPSYPLFQLLIDLNDIEPEFYSLKYQDHWLIDFSHLRSCINQKTKALILVNPNNPTGSYVKENELFEINTICKQNNLAIISDEVFYDYSFKEDQSAVSLAGNQEVLTFTLGGLSKMLALPQMKLGWTVVSGPQDQVKEVLRRLEIIADTYLSIGTPVQNALGVWLAIAKDVQEQVRNRVRSNYQKLQELIKDCSNCRLLNVEGGWYAAINIPTTKSEEDWCLDFLVNQHVYVHPGYFYDFAQEGYLVVSLLPSSEMFQEGIKRILSSIH